jgi:hypothetical protein
MKRKCVRELRPWYYQFLEVYAGLAVVFGVLGGIIFFVACMAGAGASVVRLLLGLLGGTALVGLGLLACALLLMSAEAADNLRIIRAEVENRRDARYSVGERGVPTV